MTKLDTWGEFQSRPGDWVGSIRTKDGTVRISHWWAPGQFGRWRQPVLGGRTTWTRIHAVVVGGENKLTDLYCGNRSPSYEPLPVG